MPIGWARAKKVRAGRVTQAGTVQRYRECYSLMQVMPPSKIFTFKYNDQYTLTTGAATLYGTEQVFRLNSINDPDFSGVGHQSYGHDQLSNFYNKYYITSVRVRITVFAAGEPGLYFAWGPNPSGDTATIAGTTPTTTNEHPQIKWCIVPYGDEAGPVIFDQTFNMAAVEGISQKEYTFNTNYQTTWNADPTPVYLRMAVASSAANIGVSCKCFVELWQTGKAFDRKTLAVS